MKTMFRLLLVAVLLLCTTFANGQLADSTLFKVKLEKFKAKEHNGKIITASGVAGIIIGGALCLVGNSWYNKSESIEDNETRWAYNDKGDKYMIAGYVVGGAGIVLSIPGIINWSVGHKKVREYTIKLDDARSGFYFNPKNVGVTLAFKF